jgi:hypothetical protein
MPKPMYVWSGSAWVSVATEVESLAGFATQSYADNSSNVAAGLKPIVPTSVAIGSGSSSVSTLGQVTFSSASSVSLNGCFSSTYDNYKVILDITTSGSTQISFRYRLSGSDASGSNYAYQFDRGVSTTASAGTGTLTLNELVVNNVTRLMALTDIFKPALAVATGRLTHFLGDSAVVGAVGGLHSLTTAYDGISFIPASGTMTGTVSVYGYKD